MKKDKPLVMSQLVQQSAMALTSQGIKITRQNDGPLASVAFETDLPLEQVRELLKDKASLVTKITPMSIPKPISETSIGKISRFLGRRYTISTATSLPAMGFGKIWADAQWLDGENVTFCIIDTGLDEQYYKESPWNPIAKNFFKDRVIEVFKARPWSGSCHWHGRVCAEVVAKAIHEYEGKVWRGALTKVKFYVAQALDGQGQGDSDTVHACIDWGRTKNPDGITMSLGGEHDPMLDEDVRRCWELGIPVTVAAGNSGRWPPDCDGSLNCPADAPDAIACGATNAGHVPEGQVETVQQWSSRAQRPDGSKHDWFFCGAGCDIEVDLGEPVGSGTSLFAPHAQAGVLALISLLKILQPTWTKIERALKVRDIMKATALNLGYLGSPNHTPEGAYCLQGNGRCQFDLAWDMAKKEQPNGPTPSKIDKVEFLVDNAPIGEATTGTKDVFQLDKVIEAGDHLFKGKAYSEGLDPVETESVHFKVVKATPQNKIVAKATSPTDLQEFPEGSTISFKVEAKVVEKEPTAKVVAP
jgi:hypothetical protein